MVNHPNLKERNKLYSAYLAILSSSYGIFSNYNSAIFNIATTILLKKKFNLNGEDLDSAHGNIFLIDTLGIIASIYVSFKVVTKTWKRTQILLISSLITLLVYPLTILDNLYIMYAGRFLTGVTQGLNFTCFIWISEVLPKRIIPFAFLFNNCTSLAAYLGGSAYGQFFSQEEIVDHWFYIVFTTFPVDLFRALGLLFLKFETPNYYLQNENFDEEEAKSEVMKVMEKLYIQEDVQKAIDGVITENKRITEIRNRRKVSGVKVLFTKEYINRTKIGFALALATSITGGNIFSRYSTDVFSDIEGSSGLKSTFTINIVGTVAGFIALFIVSKLPRRYLIVGGTGFQTLSLGALTLSSYYKEVEGFLVSSCFFKGISTFSLGGVAWIYIQEILPGGGLGICMVVQLIGDSIVSKILPYTIGK